MSSSNDKPRQSDYAWLKNNGWESNHHFMHSYGLKPGETGAYEEGKAILTAVRGADDREKAAASRGQSGNSYQSHGNDGSAKN
ncbi:2a1dc002-7f67-472c-af21-b0b12fc2a399 [Sclerotinia trifoliorum]|uniref:2a1dc002-7f67-472c-af21-b0b12fc2a399 n=1 Tax=Sclerotinia trifoliorum TaxID=28548 RepID=A0A8H2ZUI2_9HELO|nr:2a1dc002-7f67-472c-af21-b0b12fc2a399 [Sclerotinia trifoliorum]